MPGLQCLDVLLFWVIIGQGSRFGTGARRAVFFFFSSTLSLPFSSTFLRLTAMLSTGPNIGCKTPKQTNK